MKKKLIQDVLQKIETKKNYGVFGNVSIFINPENFKEELSDSKIETKKFNPAEDRKYKFFLHISFEPNTPEIGCGSALDFHFCRTECWISTWFYGPAKKEMENHPFILSWFRFLTINGYSQKCGLDGSCNYEILTIKEGKKFLKKWLNWVRLYS
jgi:hypothetical protein